MEKLTLHYLLHFLINFGYSIIASGCPLKLLFICLYVCNNYRIAKYIIIKIATGQLCEELVCHVNIHFNQTVLMTTLLDDLNACTGNSSHNL